MRVFLAGATGVVGRRVAPLLVAAGHSVTGVGRSSSKRAALGRLGVTTTDVDLFDARALRHAVSGHDVVINLATRIPSPSFRIFIPRAWRENDRLRREASANLVQAANAMDVARFVQESFAPVYPDRGTDWIDETVPLGPVPYNRTIVDAEASAARFAASGRASVVLRFAGFYGPDATQTAELVRLVRRGFAPIPGPAGSLLSSVSHDDAASAVVAALGAPAGTYNVVDDEPVTHREYVDTLAAALGVAPPGLPPPWLTPALGPLGRMLARSLRISNRKLREATDWRPKWHSVREGWPAVVAALGGGTGRAQERLHSV